MICNKNVNEILWKSMNLLGEGRELLLFYHKSYILISSIIVENYA